ncbi:MAG: SUF system Fe-S cluster assembly protein [Sulfurifustis sp.]
MSETTVTSDITNANVPAAPAGLHEQVVAALKTVYDPEIPVNIYDLGLIYGLDIDAEGNVRLQMTLTAPGCPVAQTFPGTVQSTIEAVAGVKSAEVELVWDPPWSRERMTQEALLQLGML